MSDYEDDHYDDESFEEGSPHKEAAPPRPAAAVEELPQANRSHSVSQGHSVEPTPRGDLNWLKPTPKTPPREPSHQNSPRRSVVTPESPPSESRSRKSSASRRSSTPRRSHSSDSVRSSPFSSPAASPEKSVAVTSPKPTSAPAQSNTARSRSSSASSARNSEPEQYSPAAAKKKAPGGSKAKPAGASPLPGFAKVAMPTTVQEINLLRLKNAELQRAIENARSQLAKVAPRMSVMKVKKRSDDERLKKLQREAQVLATEFESLSKKTRDANHVKTLERQIKEREDEIKTLSERNRFLQMEIRNNAKRLKHAVNIEEQRKSLMENLRNERIIVQMNLEKAKRDAEVAARDRDAIGRRVVELEAKDKLRDLSMDEVKRIIELRTTIASKDEQISNLQTRLAVLKRAADSSAFAKNASGGGVAPTVYQPSNDYTAIETLKEEIASMKAKLELYSSQQVDGTTASNVSKRQQAKAAAAALPPVASSGAPKTTRNAVAAPSGGGQSTKKDVSPPNGQAAAKAPAAAAGGGKRTSSAEAAGARHAGKRSSGGSLEAPLRSESVPVGKTGSGIAETYSDDDENEGAAAVVGNNPSPVTATASAEKRSAGSENLSGRTSQSGRLSREPSAAVPRDSSQQRSPTPPQAEDSNPPWMTDDAAAVRKEPSNVATLQQQRSSTVGNAAPAPAAELRKSPEAQKRSTTPNSEPSWLDESPAKPAAAAAELQTVRSNASIAPEASRTTPPVSLANTSNSVSAVVAPPPPPPAAAPTQSEPKKASDEPAWLFDE